MSDGRHTIGTRTECTSGHRAAGLAWAENARWFVATPVATVAMATCAFVAMCSFLGAAWMGTSVLGLPGGAWIVVLVVGLRILAERSQSARSVWSGIEPATRELARAVATPAQISTNSAGNEDASQPSLFASAGSGASVPPAKGPVRSVASSAQEESRPCLPPTMETLPSGWFRSALVSRAVDRAADVLADAAMDDARTPGGVVLERVSRLMPQRPLRLGLAMNLCEAELVREHLPRDVQIEHLETCEDVENAITEHVCDAVLSRGTDGALELRTATKPRHDAAWFDWNAPRPLSYAALFPFRVDCAKAAGLTMPSDPSAGGLLADLSRSAMMLARGRERLTLRDWLKGRKVLMAPAAGTGEGDTHAAALHRRLLRSSLDRLAERLAMFDPEIGGATRKTNVPRVTARVLSAALAGQVFELDVPSRRRGLEIAGRIAGDEPEVMLRLAAVRIAAYDDVLGMDALERADRMFRDCGVLPGCDPLLFVQSEIDLTPFGPMTLGRVAAGMCLACIGADADRVRWLRDDLLDDMRFSGWLVGRDQDRALLLEAFRVLERARRTEQFSLPAGRHGTKAA